MLNFMIHLFIFIPATICFGCFIGLGIITILLYIYISLQLHQLLVRVHTHSLDCTCNYSYSSIVPSGDGSTNNSYITYLEATCT